ncbi:MAG TPA: hypothetical protein VHD36_16045, partial [Pirellulales bacterium]|nr:hypothetical protein [Pirellulales bacterium]
FGLVFQQANVPPDFGIAELLGYVDFRSLVATLQGSTPIAGGAFDTTGLTFGFSAGSLDYNLNDDSGEPFMHGQMSVANASGMISGAGNGSFILGTYSIPILADVPLITPFGNFDAVFSGQLEATSLPEPSAFILASLGGLAPLGLARSRLCRRRR